MTAKATEMTTAHAICSATASVRSVCDVIAIGKPSRCPSESTVETPTAMPSVSTTTSKARAPAVT